MWTVVAAKCPCATDLVQQQSALAPASFPRPVCHLCLCWRPLVTAPAAGPCPPDCVGVRSSGGPALANGLVLSGSAAEAAAPPAGARPSLSQRRCGRPLRIPRATHPCFGFGPWASVYGCTAGGPSEQAETKGPLMRRSRRHLPLFLRLRGDRSQGGTARGSAVSTSISGSVTSAFCTRPLT